jgi:prophage regulatory protein
MKQDGKMIDKLLSSPTVGEISNLSNVTRWRMEKIGKFPKRRQISPNRVAYLESEILEWLKSRPVSGNTQLTVTTKPKEQPEALTTPLDRKSAASNKSSCVKSSNRKTETKSGADLTGCWGDE